ncbi:MAG TPA: transcription antitermination factor NusB [Candidatus Paceibacterota bacterium]
MANRHLSRSIVLQSLFEWDFNGCDNSKIDEILAHNIEEFAPGIDDTKYIESVIKGILDNQAKLDEIIVKAAPEWPLPQIAMVDRNVLRVGLYEILFGDAKEVPAKVAINEAIELAKTFGGTSSGKFVNGVLGTVYKELGEPDKDAPTRRERSKKQFDLSKLPQEKYAGAVVYREEGDNIFYLAFVHDVFGRWTLSKGHLKEGESEREAAARELKEEIGVDIIIKAELGSNEYTASDPERGKIRKTVAYFLASTKDKELHLKETGGLDNAAWFTLQEVPELKTYDDILPIITKAINILREK